MILNTPFIWFKSPSADILFTLIMFDLNHIYSLSLEHFFNDVFHVE